MLSKEQPKLLRKIKRSKSFNMTLSPKPVQDDAWFLISQNYIAHHEEIDISDNHTGQIICNITPLGKAALAERYREDRHWFIPVSISIIALIKSFLPEILLGAELLLKLLTQ